MIVETTREILCPRCKSDAVYKYGKTKDGNQRYICVVCRKQFTMRSKNIVKDYPICTSCGNGTYVYMKDQKRGIIRYRCSEYPKCKTYIVRRLI